jgi:hypothetical protein
MQMEQSVPKRRHIKFRRRGITQKKIYNIWMLTEGVWEKGDQGKKFGTWEKESYKRIRNLNVVSLTQFYKGY